MAICAWYSARCGAQAGFCAWLRQLAIGKRNLERLPKNILVAVLGRRGPGVGANPGVDLRRFNLVRDPVAKRFQNELHSALEVADIPAFVIDVPVDGFLGDRGKLDALVLRVSRLLHAANNITFPQAI